MATEAESVAAAEVIRNFGYWQQQALAKPLVVTHHGRARIMLISTEHYEELTAEPELPPGRDDGRSMAAILSHSDEGFVVLDRDYTLLTVNKTALDWLGIPAEGIIGKTLHEFLGSTRSSLFESMLQRVFRTGEAISYELPGPMFKERRLSARSFPYGLHVATVFIDVSEEHLLRDATEVLEATQSALDLLDTVATAEVDGDGRIICASPVLERMTGLRAATLAGSLLVDLFEARTRQGLGAAMAGVMSDRRCRTADAVLAIRGGTSQEAAVSFAPLERGLAVKGVAVAIRARAAVASGASSRAGEP